MLVRQLTMAREAPGGFLVDLDYLACLAERDELIPHVDVQQSGNIVK